eukprot:TRINITY_DN12487_c0_g1_i1.p2 TRINITY_DN12487_c0_g1~~TRINITY_DN12487_c0_g1_i1.p2  ORF type:complete len:114 (-),score=11.64 TRINITY_DN12487_c0_g1_i1:159-500(-)
MKINERIAHSSESSQVPTSFTTKYIKISNVRLFSVNGEYLRHWSCWHISSEGGFNSKYETYEHTSLTVGKTVKKFFSLLGFGKQYNTESSQLVIVDIHPKISICLLLEGTVES